jgi:hypothetical protein
MNEMGWLVAAGGAVLGAILAAALVWRPVRAARQESLLAKARLQFHRQRERLEARFFQLAAASGKPRGLAWTDCDFEDDVVYARDRRTRQLSAFVGVGISFEAVAGGGMEENENVQNVRVASAEFNYRNGQWTTSGRAHFNLNPTEAVRYYEASLELVH